jgi:Asp-tRNA(Asn)/Glu-tRNA(Gln) amidotransferase A subunit family amidase
VDVVTNTAGVGGLIELSAAELARQIRGRRVSAREVVEAHIARIEEVDGRLNAVVVRLFYEGVAEADAVDGARADDEAPGPLAGVPITVKEQFDVAGLATTFGLPTRAGRRVSREGPLVTRLREAGAIILGKTNVAELLFYQEGDNPLFGRTSNPWALDRSSGGGSGGEGAIIAARGSPLGLGADIGGSIRTPAHFCGIQGLRPTSWRLTPIDSPPELFFPGMEAVALDPGPMARTVDDLRLMMDVLAAPGLERADPRVAPAPWPNAARVSPEGLRVGVFEDDGYWPASPALRRAVREAATALGDRGADVVEFEVPEPEKATELYFSFLGADAVAWTRPILKGNPVDRRIRMLTSTARLPDPVKPVLARLLGAAGQRRLAGGIGTGRHRSAGEYWRLIAERNRWRGAFVAAMDAAGIDAIVCPPHTVAAHRHGATYLLYDTPSYLMRFNVLGMPAGVVAATRVLPGEESDRPRTRDAVERAVRSNEQGTADLPVGVQVAARHWREDVVLAVMGALEEHFRSQPDYPDRPPV